MIQMMNLRTGDIARCVRGRIWRVVESTKAWNLEDWNSFTVLVLSILSDDELICLLNDGEIIRVTDHHSVPTVWVLEGI